MKRTFLLIAFPFAACATVSTSPVTTGTPTAALNETANVGSLLVKPIAVLEDSRCPENVQCVWAGRLVLRTLTDGGAGAEVLDLTLGEPFKIDSFGYLTLTEAAPLKLMPGKTNAREYRFTFRFER